MLTVQVKAWIERDGRPVFGEGRARLLEAIEEARSLAAAARQLGMPYRTAWKHLNAMEKGFGKKIVERKTGGARGGGCRLTDAGRKLLRGYEKFRAGLEETLEKRLRHLLDLG